MFSLDNTSPFPTLEIEGHYPLATSDLEQKKGDTSRTGGACFFPRKMGSKR